MGVDEGVGKRVVGFRRRETECDLGVFYEQQVVDLEMGRSDLCQVFVADSVHQSMGGEDHNGLS